MDRREALKGLLGFGGLATLPPSARAQEAWPSRPVTIIAPFVPGGSSDLIARAISGPMQRAIGKPVLVENRPGANGEVAARAVNRSAPDGHILMIGSIGTWSINTALRPNLGYDAERGFTHVTLAATTPNVLVVNPERVPARDVTGLVAWLKENRGRTSYGTSGVGSSDQVTMELFKQVTGTDPTHVPYPGGGAALTDLFAGNVQMMVTNLSILTPHIQSGRLRAIFITSRERSPLLPDVATATEAGIPDLVVSSWQGVMAPPGMAPSLLRQVHAEIAKALRDEATVQRLDQIGFQVVASTPEEFATFQADEITRWRRVIQAAGITPE
ncbi:Bug family tripartite tricarboxylate transporter substrate binding protein [Humitalea sp. 24SJ18S-53]|uniref:Bug family tripartite tricarboxylate transporter substrate binding protein n=1 Tax=Humitalea sp. 24SJ18S-53 TaxID=3422307 RepID=UPI003D678ACF